ncbi:hypothetical protein MUP05_03815 [Candidatus Bathyarchaeota archaeon]|nr:hypothetical protein [Candidatus Bathyarchaeota archaeon]
MLVVKADRLVQQTSIEVTITVATKEVNAIRQLVAVCDQGVFSTASYLVWPSTTAAGGRIDLLSMMIGLVLLNAGVTFIAFRIVKNKVEKKQSSRRKT